MDNSFTRSSKEPIIIMLGPSGAGKDTVLRYAVARGVATHVKTATTRLKRSTDLDDAYVWMDPYDPNAGLTLIEHYEMQIKKFDLVEHDAHHGNLYGLPRRSLVEALKLEGIPVIRTEPAGAKTLLENLTEYNCVVLGVFPDSFWTVVRRVFARTFFSKDEHFWQRIKDSYKWMFEISRNSHLILHNANGSRGLKRSQVALEKLCKVL